MSSVRRVYLTKLCLCANPYLPVFFVLLASNGISRNAASSAVAIGTMAMFAGDALTSALSDRFGPRRVVAVCGLLQALAVAFLPSCSTVTELCWLEVLIGLAFPAIHGADSKWLRHLSEGASGERGNQSITWTSQLLSAAVGGTLLSHPTYACYLSGLLYVIGAALTLTLPDIARRLQCTTGSQRVTSLWSVLTRDRIHSIMSFAVLLGAVNTAPWLLQFHASAMYESQPVAFCLVQVLGAGLSIVGAAYHTETRTRVMFFLICLFAIVYAFASWQDTSPLIWLPIAAGMILRGSVSVAARDVVLSGIESTGPMATLTTTLNAQSKVVQATLLALLGNA